MEAVIALFKRSFETLKRFPQLFVFPALCWIVGLVFQSVLGGFMLRAMLRGSGFSLATIGIASVSGIIVQLVVQLVAAYFSAGQVRGLLLAAEGAALTPALFGEACRKQGSRVLMAKLLRVGLLLGVGIIGGLLALLLPGLGTLLALLAAAAVALLTVFWEMVIVRDGADVQPALATSYELATRNLVVVCLPLIAIGIGQSIVTAIVGSLPALSSLITQVLVAPFGGLVAVDLLQQIKTGQTTIAS